MNISKILGPVTALLLLTAAARATASPVPADTVVQNVNGVQQCVMTYTVPPGFDSGVLQKEPFELDGYEYTLAAVNREENFSEDKKSQTETVTVKTASQELSAVLAALPSAKEYDNGTYSGTLTLNTSTIRTEAAGYENSSYPVSATREFEGLDSNDLSYIPSTTNKDGVTLSLQSVDWQVEGSDMVEDMLVPSSYRAVAVYSGTGYRKTPTGYVSTASYTGTVSSRVLRDITYTVTYHGTAIPEPEPLKSSETMETAAGLETAPGGGFSADGAVGNQGSVTENIDSSSSSDISGGSGNTPEAMTAGSSDTASAELLSDKGGGDADLQNQKESEKELSLSEIVCTILGIILVILIIALIAWLYNRWKKQQAAVMDDGLQNNGDGYPPDTYMGGDGGYGGEYAEDSGYPQGFPYAEGDPYLGGLYPGDGFNYNPDVGVYPGQGDGFYPGSGQAQYPDSAEEAFPDMNGPAESVYPENGASPVESVSPEESASPEGNLYPEENDAPEIQDSANNQHVFNPQSGYIHET